MYSDKVIGPNMKRRIISEARASDELTWHRDANDRLVTVAESRGWSFQRDNQLPFELKRGDTLRVAAGEWHRVIPGRGDLKLVIKEIAVKADKPKDKKKDKLIIDLIRELSEEEESAPLDLDGTEDVSKYQTSKITDEEESVLVSEDDLLEALVALRESSKKKSKINPDYLTKDAGEMRDEIRKQAKKADDDPTAYKSYPKGDWKADYSPSGKRYKTKTSPHTAAFHKRFGEANELNELDDEMSEDEMCEGLSDKIRTALKNKAEKANAPLGALATVYRKGLAAWKTGHKPGASQHAWAMGRVNSFLVGGPARRVDAAQWKQVQKFRKKKRD